MKPPLRTRRVSILCVAIVTAILSPAALAAGPGSAPYTFRTPSGLAPLDRVPVLEQPPIDVPALVQRDAEIEARRTRPVPLRVGEPRTTDIAPDRAGRWETLPTGDRAWRVTVRTPGALWTVLGFGTFRPVPGAELRVFDPSGAVVLGPYTTADERPDGQLWTDPVAGEALIVELLWPAAADTEPLLHLGTVSGGYRDVGALGFRGLAPAVAAPEASGACEIDVNCPLGAEWQNDKRGVARMLISGSGLCTGTLINNTARDCRRYFLTANHCLSTQAAAGATRFYFNYERPGCGSGSGSLGQSVYGSTLRATWSTSDFTLLEITPAIPAEFQAFFNGWSRSTTAAASGWGLHHPAGDVKKVSHTTGPLVTGSYYGTNHWRTNWDPQGDEGVTEGGSSGSPLFDPQHRVVGQLSGGYSACGAAPADMWDEYGKLDRSWTGGGANASRLSNWLHPGATTTPVTLDGIDAAYCLAQPRLGYARSTVVDTLGNGNGSIEPGERFTLEVAVLNGGSVTATSVGGTLTTTNAQVTVRDGSAGWPNVAADTTATSSAPHFTLQVDAAIGCGAEIPLHLVNTAAEAPGSWTSDFALRVGRAVTNKVLGDDMEGGEQAWSSQAAGGAAPFALAPDEPSGGRAWSVAARAAAGESLLVMPAVTVPAEARLTFRHRFSTQNGGDGGVLEYSVAEGPWTDAAPLVVAGGYAGTLAEDGPLGRRDAWTGDSRGWQKVAVDLAALAGKPVRFRWRFVSDAKITYGTGWSVDDLSIEAITYQCDATPAGEPSDVEDGGTPFRIAKAGTQYDLTWSTPRYGASPASYRLYRTNLGGTLAPACEANLGTGTSVRLATLTNNRGFLVVARNAFGDGSFGQDSRGAERPHAATPCP